ncbi:hypothetical protein [Paucisalibacillus sp. EB02]|uniref:hypothetical protein n=1 Tax=Paucisalibacillus sp. EB02 TaxID=1347087 RepID=UPI0004B6C954|nr:hypothetical protein [Paucisalibacillus sp. EB02]
MENKARIVITLICSVLIFAAGLLRILSESSSSPTSMVVAYVFLITGLIGVVANSIVLRKVLAK